MLSALQNLFCRKKSELTIGIVGQVNAGKTTLANRMGEDFAGKTVGTVSPIPHETREVQRLENVNFKHNGTELTLNICDTPGIATQVDFNDFTKHGLTRKQSIQRAKEATQGVVKAIEFLSELDAAIVVVDSSMQPFNQVNWTILGNLRAREIPIIIAANKTDLPKADMQLVQETFDGSKVVPISALKGDNISALYQAIYEVA